MIAVDECGQLAVARQRTCCGRRLVGIEGQRARNLKINDISFRQVRNAETALGQDHRTHAPVFARRCGKKSTFDPHALADRGPIRNAARDQAIAFLDNHDGVLRRGGRARWHGQEKRRANRAWPAAEDLHVVAVGAQPLDGQKAGLRPGCEARAVRAQCERPQAVILSSRRHGLRKEVDGPHRPELDTTVLVGDRQTTSVRREGQIDRTTLCRQRCQRHGRTIERPDERALRGWDGKAATRVVYRQPLGDARADLGFRLQRSEFAFSDAPHGRLSGSHKRMAALAAQGRDVTKLLVCGRRLHPTSAFRRHLLELAVTSDGDHPELVGAKFPSRAALGQGNALSRTGLVEHEQIASNRTDHSITPGQPLDARVERPR